MGNSKNVIIVIILVLAGGLLIWQFGPNSFEYPKGGPADALNQDEQISENSNHEVTNEGNDMDLPKGTSELANGLSSIDKLEIQITDGVRHLIPLEDIFDGGPGKDGIPSIDNPTFVSLAEAKGDYNEEGLGLLVTINGETRFYPYQILVWHEIVNDKIGDTPIAVTFCPLCGSGLVFERKINGGEVEFGVSGKLHESNLLMYDRKTDSLWGQILGQAVVGPLTGMILDQLPSNVVRFKTIAEKFPEAKILAKDTGFFRDYDNGPYGNYNTNSSLFFPVGRQDDRIHSKTRVLGVEIEGKFKAYPVDSVKDEGVIKDTFAGRQLELNYNDGLIKITDKTSNSEIIPANTFWFGWFAFHPGTELYEK